MNEYLMVMRNHRGVNIEVAPGQPPISVVPGAGKASNLNADQLDGKDQQDFLSASRIYRVGNSVAKAGPGDGGEVTITGFPSPEEGLACDDGDVAIGGGGSSTDIEDDLICVERAAWLAPPRTERKR